METSVDHSVCVFVCVCVCVRSFMKYDIQSKKSEPNRGESRGGARVALTPAEIWF